MHRITVKLLAAVVMLPGLSCAAEAAVFCVGRGAATHASLAQAVAAAAANGPDTDFIYLDAITHAVPDTVLIENQSVEILGGFAFCQTLLAPTGIATLDGSGGQAASVLEIRASPASAPREVRLDRVTITGGGNDGTGGGLHLDGLPLTVRLGPLTTLTGNVSSNGGGLFLRSARLYLEGASLVGNDALNAGGGLDCVSTQFYVAASTSVRFNEAPRGGGYSLRDDCGVIFYGGNAQSIFANRARIEGGGLVASAGATVQIVRGEAVEPGPIGRDRSLRIAANQAGERGAGIALQQAARLYANGVTLIANNLSAPSNTLVEPLGGAIYAGTGTVLSLGLDPRCAVDEACNLVLNNVVNRTPQTFAAGGAGIAAIDARVVTLRHVEFSGNAINGGAGSASALLVDDIEFAVDLSRLLFHGNNSLDGSIVPHVVQIASTPAASLDFLTIADNLIDGSNRAAVRIAGVADLAWRSSIIDQATDPTAAISSSPQPQFDCLLARELTTLPGATRSFAQAALFRDRANADYRPAPGSPQVDACDGPALNGPFEPIDFDLSMHPLPADTLTVDLFGRYDLGALESQEFLVAPALFADGFESP